MEVLLAGRVRHHQKEMDEVKTLLEDTRDAAISLAEAEEEELAERAAALEEVARQYVKALVDLEINVRVLSELRRDAGARGDAVEFMSRRISELSAERGDDAVDRHPLFRGYRSDVWAALRPGEAMPGDELGDGEELVLRGGTTLKCPLTGSLLQEPVKSSLCGHRYSKEAVLAYLKRHRDNSKCPVSGCSANLKQNMLSRDQDAEFELKRAEQKKKRKKAPELTLDI